ncbi:MAG: winged helix-turn-helix transcriptional regulator [Bdellovibrio sp.]|nr:winged helix-turn-helix transcriptional regulator [Bdellovibrio sp.]
MLSNSLIALPNHDPNHDIDIIGKLHQRARKKIIRQMQPKKMFFLLAETFLALGDASRVQIIWALTQGELCVGEIAELLEMSQPTVSHHLRTLRNLKLVKVRKNGLTSS